MNSSELRAAANANLKEFHATLQKRRWILLGCMVAALAIIIAITAYHFA